MNNLKDTINNGVDGIKSNSNIKSKIMDVENA